MGNYSLLKTNIVLKKNFNKKTVKASLKLHNLELFINGHILYAENRYNKWYFLYEFLNDIKSELENQKIYIFEDDGNEWGLEIENGQIYELESELVYRRIEQKYEFDEA